tara:strand:+ start:1479 stop:2792 length:1314 start_codon:yes stop_codon:yes gene_type:complete
MKIQPHEYGPVTEYHGTVDLPKVLSQGIRGGNPKTRSNRYIPEGMREEELISYTHPNREMALAYAQDRANRMKLDPKKVGVVGVRGTQLPEAVEHQEPKEGIFAGTSSLVRPGGISPEYLIQASEDKMKPKKKKGVVLIISVGPKMPRKPTDEATPDKEVKKSFSKPMELAFQLLKDDDKNRTIEDAFDLGQEILPYDKLHDKQKQIVDAIANAPPSYWNDPASGELETENYAGMFENDRQHFYPDEAFNQYLRYIQHFHDASSKVNELPHEKQMEIMSHYDNFQEEHPLHPAKVALDKMAEEHEDWGGANPHEDFWQRYNEPQVSMEEGGGFFQDFSETHKSKPMKLAYQLLKRNLSPAARKHKLEYDTKYQSSPKRVKYRVELNRERRRRGIYGSGNGKDVSHTQGGKLTLENEHDNRARHFKNRGTLRKVKVKK